MINLEHVIVQHVVSLFFSGLISTNYTKIISVTKIVEIMYSQHCQAYRNFPSDCARNMLEEKSQMRQGLICAEILSLHVLPPSPLQYDLT